LAGEPTQCSDDGLRLSIAAVSASLAETAFSKSNPTFHWFIRPPKAKVVNFMKPNISAPTISDVIRQMMNPASYRGSQK
jgi:hypothetical protein